jgi:hypothetical protein
MRCCSVNLSVEEESTGNLPCGIQDPVQLHTKRRAYVQFHWEGKDGLKSVPAHSFLDSCNIFCFIENLSLSGSWHVRRSLSALSKRTEPILHLRLRHTCSIIDGNQRRISAGYILPIQETDSPPFRPVLTDSPAGTPCLICAVKFSAQATHTADFTVYTSVWQCVHRIKRTAAPSALSRQRREWVSVERVL